MNEQPVICWKTTFCDFLVSSQPQRSDKVGKQFVALPLLYMHVVTAVQLQEEYVHYKYLLPQVKFWFTVCDTFHFY